MVDQVSDTGSQISAARLPEWELWSRIVDPPTNIRFGSLGAEAVTPGEAPREKILPLGKRLVRMYS